MKRLFSYAGAVLSGGAAAVIVFWSKGLFSGLERPAAMRILSDGFLAAGLLLLAAAALVTVSDAGMFDGIAFAFRNLFVALHGRKYREEHRAEYAAYKAARHSDKKRVWFLWITGGGYTLLAVLFACLFYVYRG